MHGQGVDPAQGIGLSDYAGKGLDICLAWGTGLARPFIALGDEAVPAEDRRVITHCGCGV